MTTTNALMQGWNVQRFTRLGRVAVVGSLSVVLSVGAGSPAPSTALSVPPSVPPSMTWLTVVNNGDAAPGSSSLFNSYNQPSVNTSGLVAFRARTKGGDGGEPLRGIYSRNARDAESLVRPVFDVETATPQPNNLDAQFNEFPSFPRIDRTSDVIVTRGQSKPVWKYLLPDLTETRAGTSGVYFSANGVTGTAASLLGAVPGFEHFAVPGAPAGTRFSQFPGAPAVDGSLVVFKGNYTDLTTGEARTGVYFRDVSTPGSPITLIADSQMLVPGQGPDGTVRFDSTAPPSAANGMMVFLGLDNEDNPSMGAIYLAPLETAPTLQPLVSIGDQVPGMEPTDRFTRLGEGLSFDGRYVAFWGAWGSEKMNIVLQCPADGNKDLLKYCNEHHPDGYATTVSAHQGMFVYDTKSGTLRTVAVTDARFSTFQYWVYSGAPPNVGGSEDTTREPPRWRSSAFIAVSGHGDSYQAAFKASMAAGGVGIFLVDGPSTSNITTVVDTTFAGTAVDPEAPADTFVSTVGIERDGFRGNFIAVNLGMINADASASWAGVYLVTLRTPYEPVGPARLVESRVGEGYATVDGVSAGIGARAADSVTEVQVTGRAGVPVGASAVQLNVTVTNPGEDGFVTVFPCGSPRPLASNLNYQAGSTLANAVIAQVGDGGRVCIYTQRATDLVVDIAGYFPTS